MTIVAIGLYMVIFLTLMGIYYIAKDEFKISDEMLIEIVVIVIAGEILDKILRMIC